MKIANVMTVIGVKRGLATNCSYQGSLRMIHNENGRAGLICLLSLAALGLFIKYGQLQFGAQLHPAITISTLFILGVIALFSGGYAIHMRLIGRTPKKRVTKELEARATDLADLTRETRTRIKYFEEVMTARANSITRRGTDCLALLKKIVGALENRLFEVNKLLATNNQFDLMDAYELLRQKLVLNENCLESLIESEPIPAMEPYEWEPTITKLLDQIEYELRLVA